MRGYSSKDNLFKRKREGFIEYTGRLPNYLTYNPNNDNIGPSQPMAKMKGRIIRWN